MESRLSNAGAHSSSSSNGKADDHAAKLFQILNSFESTADEMRKELRKWYGDKDKDKDTTSKSVQGGARVRGTKQTNRVYTLEQLARKISDVYPLTGDSKDPIVNGSKLGNSIEELAGNILKCVQQVYMNAKLRSQRYKQIDVYEGMMLLLIPFYRTNGLAYDKDLMPPPTQQIEQSSVQLYDELISRGLLPLSVELDSERSKPIQWVSSLTFDFASVLRQHICVHTKRSDGTYVFFYDKATVNTDIVSVSQDEDTTANSMYLQNMAAEKTAQQQMEKMGAAVATREGTQEKIQRLDSNLHNELVTKIRHRTDEFAHAFRNLLGPSEISDIDHKLLREEVKQLYKCNGVDVDRTRVNVNVRDYLKSTGMDDSCIELTGKPRYKVHGYRNKSEAPMYLNYTFRVMPKLYGKDVRSLMSNFMQGLDSSGASAFENLRPLYEALEAVAKDIDQLRKKEMAV